MVLCRTPALDGCAVDLFKFHPGKISAGMTVVTASSNLLVESNIRRSFTLQTHTYPYNWSTDY